MSFLLILIFVAIFAAVGLLIGLVLKNRLVWRVCASVLCAIALFALWIYLHLAAGLIFYVVFGATLPWLPVTVCVLLFLLLLLLIWRPFAQKANVAAALSLAGLLVLLAAGTAAVCALWK